jgi:hypothetical protein
MAGLDPAIQCFCISEYAWFFQRADARRLDGAHTLVLCAKGGHDE